MQVMQMASSTDLKTAEVIRLTITPSVLDLADELTECHDGKSSGLILLTIESGSVRLSGFGTPLTSWQRAEHGCSARYFRHRSVRLWQARRRLRYRGSEPCSRSSYA